MLYVEHLAISCLTLERVDLVRKTPLKQKFLDYRGKPLGVYLAGYSLRHNCEVFVIIENEVEA